MREAWRLPAALVLLVPLAAGWIASAGPASGSPVAYDGTASANGVQLRVQVPALSGLTDTPVDGGGPTAQAVAGSLGTGTGYAAFPDPGQFVVSVPGLLAGLTAGRVPSLPAYPFFVRADGASEADQALGDGPYRLRASRGEATADASASAGLDLSGAGQVALVRSTSTVGPEEDGGVVARASVEVTGLAIGPVRIGSLVAESTMAIDSSGARSRASSLRLRGVELAGLPVGLSGEGLELAGPAAPLPLQQVLDRLLAPLGLRVRVLAAEHLDDAVISPALQLTLPISAGSIPDVADVAATAVVTIGATTASLVGAVARDDPSPPPSSPPATSSPPAAPATSPPAATATVPPPTTVPAVRTARRVGLLDQWDASGVHLAVLAGAVLVPGAGELVRRRGAARC